MKITAIYFVIFAVNSGVPADWQKLAILRNYAFEFLYFYAIIIHINSPKQASPQTKAKAWE